MGRGRRRLQGHVPEIAAARQRNHRRRSAKQNRAFVKRSRLLRLCRQAINPNLSVEAVETMLIQHLLTERIFRRVFDNSASQPQRHRRRDRKGHRLDHFGQFSRDEFLKDLDRFYKAIEQAADNTRTTARSRVPQHGI